MPKKPSPSFDENKLNKGHLRKLTALRKSLGQKIADQAFGQWLEQIPTEKGEPEDQNAKVIVRVLEPFVLGKQLNIPRGGYLLRRGRGRIIVTRARTE